MTGAVGPGSSGREVLCGLALAERLRRRGAREPVLVVVTGSGRGRFEVSMGRGDAGLVPSLWCGRPVAVRAAPARR